MAKFIDAKGGEWTLEITYADYRRLKRDTALDLDKLRENETLLAEIVYGTPEELVKVMECLLGEQVKRSGLSVEEFHERFDPATVDRSGDALLESILDFFLRRRATPEVKAWFGAKWKEMETTLSESHLTNSVVSSPEPVG